MNSVESRAFRTVSCGYHSMLYLFSAALSVFCPAAVGVSGLADQWFRVEEPSRAVAYSAPVFAESGSPSPSSGVAREVLGSGGMGSELSTLCRDFPLRAQAAR